MDLAALGLRSSPDGALLPVRVQPRASRDAVVGLHGEALKVALTAPPVDGAANEALLRFLGRTVLGVAPSALEIVRGHTGRDKVVLVRGAEVAAVRAKLER